MLWKKISDAVYAECTHANEFSHGLFQIQRTPLSITVRHKSGRFLSLKYNELAPCIAWTESGKQPENIMFRIDNSPAPSLTPIFVGRPYVLDELVIDLVITFTNN